MENPSCSACGHSSQVTSHLILHCPATGSFFAIFILLSRESELTVYASRSFATLSLRSLVQALGSCPASRQPWSSVMPPSLGRSRVTTTTYYYSYGWAFQNYVYSDSDSLINSNLKYLFCFEQLEPKCIAQKPKFRRRVANFHDFC